ncbi:MAG: hypothetical protein HXS48_01655 [Theionarchaea archaeon]|nr:hypothetical protein [Theionarchaea archaeon]
MNQQNHKGDTYDLHKMKTDITARGASVFHILLSLESYVHGLDAITEDSYEESNAITLCESAEDLECIDEKELERTRLPDIRDVKCVREGAEWSNQ